jgi:uncharacterized protein (TIGR03067 family)
MKMKMMPHLKLFLLASLALAGFAGCGHKAAKAGLEGRWTGYDVARPAEPCVVTINGNQLEYRGAQSNDWVRGTFVLNEAAQPKQMDLAVQEAPPGGAGKTYLVIYEQQGDEMKVAVPGNGQRPVDFAAKPQVRVYSFKRD